MMLLPGQIERHGSGLRSPVTTHSNNRQVERGLTILAPLTYPIQRIERVVGSREPRISSLAHESGDTENCGHNHGKDGGANHGCCRKVAQLVRERKGIAQRRHLEHKVAKNHQLLRLERKGWEIKFQIQHRHRKLDGKGGGELKIILPL